MNQWKFSLRCTLSMVLMLLLSSCSSWEEAARRKIKIYDVNQRKVIAVLDHASPECPWREFFERTPDFKSKTFATLQRDSETRAMIVRKYTFEGHLLEQWRVPKRHYPDHFSIRGDYFFFTDLEAIGTNYITRLMVRQLSKPNTPDVILSPKPFTLSLASSQRPPFVFIDDNTLLCLMKQKINPNPLQETLQLWKLSLNGDKVLLSESVQMDFFYSFMPLSTDLSGNYHALQINKNEVVFLDNSANSIAQLSVNFRIRRTNWDDDSLFWAYEFPYGEYVCYDVKKKKIIKQGTFLKRKKGYIGPFFAGQYIVVHKHLFWDFYHRTIQDLTGKHIATLPFLTSMRLYLGDGRLLIEDF